MNDSLGRTTISVLKENVARTSARETVEDL